MNWTIETLGKLVLIVLIAVAIIIFIIMGITGQMGAFNQTSQNILENISQRAEESKITYG